MVPDTFVKFPVALPSFAPVVAVLGVEKSRALKSVQVPFDKEVASKLY